MTSRPLCLESSGKSIFVAKFLLPLICLVPAIGFVSEGIDWRYLFALPFLLLSFFGASLAVVEVIEDRIRFRRTLKWHELDPNRVLWAKPVWPPFIGCIKLRKAILAWGRLYFVLDKNTESNPFRRGEFPILRYLNSEKFTKPGQTSVPPSITRPATLKLLLGVFIGVLSCLMVFYLTPSSLLQPNSSKPSANMPTLLRLQLEVVEWVHRWPVQLAGFATVAFLAVKRRNRPDAWLYGFLSGFGVTAILGRWWN